MFTGPLLDEELHHVFCAVDGGVVQRRPLPAVVRVDVGTTDDQRGLARTIAIRARARVRIMINVKRDC